MPSVEKVTGSAEQRDLRPMPHQAGLAAHAYPRRRELRARLARVLCVGAVLRRVQTMGVNAFGTVLITGLGPVGLGALVNARYRGARAIVVDSIPYRTEIARKMGAAAVLDPREPDVVQRILELTGERGADCSLDCSGNVKAERLEMRIDATRRRSRWPASANAATSWRFALIPTP